MPTSSGHLTHAEMKAVCQNGGSVIQDGTHYLTEKDIPSDAQLASHDPVMARQTRDAIDQQIALLASQRQMVMDAIDDHERKGKTGPDKLDPQMQASAVLAPLEQRYKDRQTQAPAAVKVQLGPKPFDTKEVAEEKARILREKEEEDAKIDQERREWDAKEAARVKEIHDQEESRRKQEEEARLKAAQHGAGGPPPVGGG